MPSVPPTSGLTLLVYRAARMCPSFVASYSGVSAVTSEAIPLATPTDLQCCKPCPRPLRTSSLPLSCHHATNCSTPCACPMSFVPSWQSPACRDADCALPGDRKAVAFVPTIRGSTCKYYAPYYQPSTWGSRPWSTPRYQRASR